MNFWGGIFGEKKEQQFNPLEAQQLITTKDVVTYESLLSFKNAIFIIANIVIDNTNNIYKSKQENILVEFFDGVVEGAFERWNIKLTLEEQRQIKLYFFYSELYDNNINLVSHIEKKIFRSEQHKSNNFSLGKECFIGANSDEISEGASLYYLKILEIL